MTEHTYNIEPDAYGIPVLMRRHRPDARPRLVAAQDWRKIYAAPEVFAAATAVLAPDGTVCELIDKVIKDAYYRGRDKGGTMHTAAEDARDAVLAALKEHATGGGSGE